MRAKRELDLAKSQDTEHFVNGKRCNPGNLTEYLELLNAKWPCPAMPASYMGVRVQTVPLKFSSLPIYLGMKQKKAQALSASSPK